MKSLNTLMIFAVAGVAGCGVTEATVHSGEETLQLSEAQLRGGCRVVCPKCTPNQICPKIACRIECPPGRSTCGENVCGKGEYCCNASCGICAPEGGGCIQLYCEPAPPTGCTVIALCVEGYVWDDKSCSCVPAGGTCTTDADCTLMDDYCDGCNCLALGPGQTLPACQGTIVNCFAQPCMNRTAVCLSGKCSVQ